MTELKITSEAISAEILARKEEIIKDVVSNFKTKLGGSIEWSLQDMITKEVSTIVKEQMMEEIKVAVVACKQEIIEQITASCSQIAAEVGKSLVKKAVTNLEGYRGGEVVKQLLGY